MTAFEIMTKCIERGGAITRLDFEVYDDVLETFVMTSYGLLKQTLTGNEDQPVRYEITPRGRAFHASILRDRT